MNTFGPKGENRAFNLKVYGIVSQIPEGKVASYGQIAAYIGSPHAARAVGTAMRNTPEYADIPCHRVVHRSGALCPDPVFHGLQREMLEREGAVFKPNGCVDMEKCMWRKSC